jgi:dTMP kinase
VVTGQGTPARGRLIVFEGLYSCGKSTQLSMLRVALSQDAGRPVVRTEWNSSDMLAAFMLEQRMKGALSPRLLYLLELADFTQRYERTILPALVNGHTVLADRYVLTGIVRAAVRGVSMDYCLAGYSFAVAPDLTLYFDCTPRTTLQRRTAKGQSITGYVSGEDYLTAYASSEEAFLAYQQALNELYRNGLPQASVIIDAEHGIEDVRRAVTYAVAGAFPDLIGGHCGRSGFRPDDDREPFARADRGMGEGGS